MKLMNGQNIDDDKDALVPLEEEIVQTPEEPVSRRRRRKVAKVFADVLGGDMFSKDGFLSLTTFFVYIVFLMMIYITNVYFAEDTSREIMKTNRKIEDLHVEYVYIQSEITKITRQSNMVKMLKNKGIKESVEPLRKIVVEKEGGRDED